MLSFIYLLRQLVLKSSLLWKLIGASVLMLVAGFIGEAFSDGSTAHSVKWGVISTLGYVYILYTAWYGEVASLAASSGNDAVKSGVRALAWFVLVGWAIYPIGYMCMPGGWLNTSLGWDLIKRRFILQHCRCYQQNRFRFGSILYCSSSSKEA